MATQKQPARAGAAGLGEAVSAAIDRREASQRIVAAETSLWVAQDALDAAIERQAGVRAAEWAVDHAAHGRKVEALDVYVAERKAAEADEAVKAARASRDAAAVEHRQALEMYSWATCGRESGTYAIGRAS